MKTSVKFVSSDLILKRIQTSRNNFRVGNDTTLSAMVCLERRQRVHNYDILNKIGIISVHYNIICHTKITNLFLIIWYKPYIL